MRPNKPRGKRQFRATLGFHSILNKWMTNKEILSMGEFEQSLHKWSTTEPIVTDYYDFTGHRRIQVTVDANSIGEATKYVAQQVSRHGAAVTEIFVEEVEHEIKDIYLKKHRGNFWREDQLEKLAKMKEVMNND